LLKELTEAYAVVLVVRTALRAAWEGGAEVDSVSGAGAVLFDICAGKGIATLLLSCALPSAVVVLVDSDLRMDLSHLSGREATGQVVVHDARFGTGCCIRGGVLGCVMYLGFHPAIRVTSSVRWQSSWLMYLGLAPGHPCDVISEVAEFMIDVPWVGTRLYA
jgi:hypothetical protein